MAQRRQVIIKKVFLDSSVLFTAVNSPIGGSAKLFILKNIKLVTSPLVLAEVERNVRKKLEDYQLDRFFLLVTKIEILNQTPNKTLIKNAQKTIVSKDAVILAESKQAKTDILVTLDKKHFLTGKVRQFLKPQKIYTPKMLLEDLKIARITKESREKNVPVSKTINKYKNIS